MRGVVFAAPLCMHTLYPATEQYHPEVIEMRADGSLENALKIF